MRRPNQAVPLSGRVLPVTTSIIVVFPAPFGPMTQSNSPGSTYSDSESSALKPSKLTVTFSRYSALSSFIFALQPAATRRARAEGRS